MPLITAERIAIAREHLRANRVSEAENELISILNGSPDSVPAKTLLAVLYFRSGRLEEASQLLTEVRRLSANQVDATRLLAMIKKAKGEYREAISLFEEVVAESTADVDLLNQLGLCWLGVEDPISAGNIFRKAIELDRIYPSSYFNLGLALKMSGRSFETFLTFKRAAELEPNSLDIYAEVWQQMRQLLNWREGVSLLESGLKRFPDSARMAVMLATTYGKIGKEREAEELFKRAIRLDPESITSYAHWLQEEGRFDESVPILIDSIRDEPIQGEAYYNLAVAKCFEVNGRSLKELVPPLLDHAGIAQEGKMFLHYALARVYEQEKNYEVAMGNYDAANDLAYRLYNAQIKHDYDAVEREHEALLALYSRESFERFQAKGALSTTPIFIVGMIRTGTTLLDQILASHSKVRSAGEQPFWQVSAGRVNRRWTESGVNPKDLKDLAADYLKVLREAAGDSLKITDKMPTNFIHIGLMSLVFPKAKFIHTRRNPLDTCLSIYTTFLGNGTQFAYRQENIVAYYREYLRVMEHWRNVLPQGRMIEIDYEELVSDKERVITEVLEFCGLELEEACLHHETNRSRVSTPSLFTARQPVNTRSVERWRNYAPYMKELLELQDLIHPAAP